MHTDDITEEWRPVLGHEGSYEVSSIGRARSLTRKVKYRRSDGFQTVPGRMLKPNPDVRGYLQVSVSRLGKARSPYIHTLVLEAFHGPRPDGMQCRHLDGNLTNNIASNLKWGTRKENAADKHIHGTHAVGSRSVKAKLTEEKVAEMRKLRASGVELKPLAAVYGVDVAHVCAICKGRFWKHVPSYGCF